MGAAAKPNLVQAHYDDIGQTALDNLAKGTETFLVRNLIDLNRKSSTRPKDKD